ncbi:SDR family NAD(P)-dependent oxidoreductase [Congregibacter litoralis]|uniref:Dehydrogenase n=1 Tax=Congregibacter litoralis KT71 TaxID=314285 RepID=A4AAT7_9GAMM|nr:glucose 1-dehydrogenase [Congregibacter litoralis]EAQ96809.1 Dehydrogenase with unknown specificity [Congregibacter litoralis KT71]
MQGVKDKTVILTGGAGDIAKVAARRFVDAGAKVMLVDLDESSLRDIASECREDDLRYTVADVTSETDTAAYVAATVGAFGGVDVLLANAGVEGPSAPVSEFDLQSFQKVLDVNVMGVFLGIKHVFPVMAAGGGGSVVITSSVAGVSATPGICAYGTSKHAVIGLMRACAKEGGPQNIRVNTINPSPVEGRMMRSLESGLMPEDPTAQYEAIKSAIPMERYADPEDVANLMLFLASEESRFLNGATYMVDGGMTA